LIGASHAGLTEQGRHWAESMVNSKLDQV